MNSERAFRVKSDNDPPLSEMTIESTDLCVTFIVVFHGRGFVVGVFSFTDRLEALQLRSVQLQNGEKYQSACKRSSIFTDCR